MEGRGPREVALPAQGLAQMRHALRDEVGPVAAIHALHAAGYAAGEGILELFQKSVGSPLGELPEEELWSRLSEFFGRRGWGGLRHRAPHPGVGILESPDWAESLPDSESQPACAFTTGLLSSFLTDMAGGPVAVLEVSCRSRGDELCRFAFGSEATIQSLYEKLVDGATLDEALERL